MNSNPEPSRRIGVFVAVALVLLGVHLLLVRYYFGTSSLPTIPFNRGDFSTHAAQVRRVLEGLELAGQHWVYDVQLLAGTPNGVLFDADNKGWELWTWALVKLGVGEGKAFNGFVLAIHLAVPFVVYAAARLARLDRGTALTAVGLAIAVWGFDSFVRWMWFVGTVSYVFVGYFALIPLVLFHRWIEDRRAVFAAGCAASLAFGHLVHPYIFFILVAPMLAVYIRAGFVERSMTKAEHGVTVAIAALTLVANGWWLRTALRFVHYLIDAAYYEQGGLGFVVYDFFGLLVDPSTQGMIGPHTAVRVGCLIAAVLAIRAWRRSQDRRALPFTVAIVTMAALTYLGGYTPLARFEPYRHDLPLVFVSLIPASVWLTETARARPWRGLEPRQQALAALVGVFVVQYLARDVLYFFAPSLPDRQIVEGGREVPMGALGHLVTPSYRYTEQHDWEPVIAWVSERDDGQGRWLVQDQNLGEYLTARTQAQIVGGFLVRNLEHTDANWFRRVSLDPPYDAEAMRHYFETYAIRWVIVQRLGLSPWWDEHRDLLVRAGAVNDSIVYQVKPRFRLLDGPGTVAASTNRIEVRGSRPEDDLVLRYHWLETLRCVPDCAIGREAVEGDRVGFIVVHSGHPSDFVIENSYAF